MTDLKQPEIEKINKEDLLKVPEEQTSQQDDRQFSEFEQICMERGWDPNGTMNAREWDENGWKHKQKKVDSLFNTIEKLKNKLEQQERDAYAKARADLEAQRIEAIEMADVERVRQIEDQTKQLIDPSVKEHADAFITKHQAWWNGTSYRDREMQLVCRNKDDELRTNNLPPEEHFLKLEEYMKNKYSDYFKVEPTPIADAVEGKQPASVKTASNKKKLTFDDLDEFQKRAARNLQKTRGISIEDYIKRLTELDNR